MSHSCAAKTVANQAEQPVARLVAEEPAPIPFVWDQDKEENGDGIGILRDHRERR